MRDEACFEIWLDAGPLAELETEDWRQGVGLWDLLCEGTGVTGMGEGESDGVMVWVGVTGVSEGVWVGIEVRAV